MPHCTTPTPGPNQPVTIKGQPGSFTGFGITDTLPPTQPTTFNPFLPTQQPTPSPQPSTPKPDGEIVLYTITSYKGLEMRVWCREDEESEFQCLKSLCPLLYRNMEKKKEIEMKRTS